MPLDRRTVGLVTAPFLLALACAAIWLLRPPSVQTSLYGMADGGGIPAALRARSEGLVPVIVSAPSPDTARAAADDLASRLASSPDGTTVRYRDDDAPDGSPSSILGATLDAILSRRSGLVSPEDAALLATPEGRARIARAAARRYATSPIPPLFPPAEDPFCLADRFVSSLPIPRSGWERRDGVLTAEGGGLVYLLMRLELAPRTAAGGRPLEDFAARLAATIDAVHAAHPNATLSPCGAPMHTAAAAARCRREIGWLTAFSLAVIAALSLWAFRGVRWLPLLAASLAVAAEAGALALLLLFREIHAMALVFGTAVLGLVVDCSFHWLMAADRDRPAVARALAASFATTEIGLLPLAVSSLPVLRQAAAFLAAGLAGALAYVLLCYPRGDTALPASSADPDRTARRRRFARWAAALLLLAAAPGLLAIHPDTSLTTLYLPPADLAHTEKLFAELGATSGNFLVTDLPGAPLETLLSREDASGIPDGTPALSRILPPLDRRRAAAAHIAELYAEQGARQSEWLGLPALVPPPPPAPWDWTDIPPAAREAFTADSALVVPSAPPPLASPLPDGVVWCRPASTLADLLAIWSAEARRRLAWALAAMAAALLLLRGRRAVGDALPPLLALAAASGFTGYAGSGIGLFHLLAGFLLAGMGVDYAIFLRANDASFRPALCSLLTSAAGFGALAFVTLPPAKAFGTVLGAGLPAAFLCALAAPPARAPAAPSTEKCASPLGLEILYWIHRLLGLRALHFAASAVALCAWTFSRSARRACPSPEKLLAFARSMADKMAVLSGPRGAPAVVPDDTPDMRAFMDDVTSGRGVFVLSSHCGTIEVLPALPGGGTAVFHAWMDIDRTSVFNAFYLRHAHAPRVRIHPISAFAPDTVFEAGDALDAGDCLVMAADSGRGRTLRVPFGPGGATLDVREGALRLARALSHPVYFVACLELAPGRYLATARRIPPAPPSEMALSYSSALHPLVSSHPSQWFHWTA